MRLPFWQRALRLTVANAAVFACVLTGWWLWNTIPGGENPFQRLYLRHPIGTLTQEKIIALDEDPSWCRFALEVSSVEFAPIADRTEGQFCGFENAVSLRRTVTDYSAPVRVSCPMAAAIYLWERDVLQPLAREHLGTEIARVDHVGTYACRRVYGGRTGQPSQHATANAMDVVGFATDRGEVVSVLNDWGEDTEEGRFLRALRDGSCAVFTGVLGPEYNARHRDHFHFDLGPYDICD